MKLLKKAIAIILCILMFICQAFIYHTEIIETLMISIAFAVAVIPEGLIEFIPEMKTMIANLNDIMPSLEKDSSYSNGSDTEKIAIIENTLSSENSSVFKSLPALIKSQLLMDRDPHGNVQVSKIETEKLLISMVEEKLASLKKEGKFCGDKL